MPTGSPRVAAIVLAAGAGRRFGGTKLAARIAGRPILQHVLDALAMAGIDDPIVVVEPDSRLEPSIAWHGARRVVNPEPGRGLSSSLQLGWAAALAADPPPDAVLVALGDQPRLTAEAIRAVVAAPLDPARPIVAARFPESGARNPVRIEIGTIADELVRATTGDRGLGPVLDARPDLVRWLDLPGDNPDIDRRADLVAAIEADWADRVRRNREQVERLRETGEDADHYAPVTGMFRDDPRRSGDEVLDALLALTTPSDTWLDVGAGAGRYAFPIALRVHDVIAIDPSAAMVATLRDGISAHGLVNVRAVEGRWPGAAPSLAPQPCADVALIANVGHDVESIGPFVDALDAAARRLCVAVMQEQPPASPAAPFFEAVHGERRIPLPALPDFLDLLAARGTPPDIDWFERPARRWQSRDELLPFLRRQTWVTPGSAGDQRLLDHLDAVAIVGDGGFVLAGDTEPARVGLVRWTPRTDGPAGSARQDLRPPEQVALGHVDAEHAQHHRLRLVLDALRDQPEAGPQRVVHEPRGERLAQLVGVDPANEADVHLRERRLELEDVAHAGKAGARVVNRTVDVAERIDREPDRAVVRDRHVLGDLEDDVPVRRQCAPEAIVAVSTTSGETLMPRNAPAGSPRARSPAWATAAISKSVPSPAARASAKRMSGGTPSPKRASASYPTTASVPRSTIGWKATSNSRLVRIRRSRRCSASVSVSAERDGPIVAPRTAA